MVDTADAKKMFQKKGVLRENNSERGKNDLGSSFGFLSKKNSELQEAKEQLEQQLTQARAEAGRQSETIEKLQRDLKVSSEIYERTLKEKKELQNRCTKQPNLETELTRLTKEKEAKQELVDILNEKLTQLEKKAQA